MIATEHYRALPESLRLQYSFAVLHIEETPNGNIINAFGYSMSKTDAMANRKDLTNKYKGVKFVTVPVN